mgnify:CR=1 FL=1
MLEFEEKGFAGSSLGGIAKRAGISRTTIYLYYDTKEAILEAAFRNSVEQAIDQVAHVVQAQSGDFRTVFSSALDVIYSQLVEGDAASFLKILVAEGHTMPNLVAFYRHEILSKGEAVIEALIARGIASGELSEDRRAEDVRIYMSPAIFAALWMRVFGQIDPLDLTEFKDAHVRLVTDALLERG